MKNMFPYIENFSSDSLYVELKNEFEKNSEYVKRQEIIEKLIKKWGFKQEFLFITNLRLIGVLLNVKIVKKSLLLFMFLFLPFFICIVFTMAILNDVNLPWLVYVLSFGVGFLSLIGNISSFLKNIIENFPDIKNKMHNYYYLKDEDGLLGELYPDFFNKTLSKKQLLQLKEMVWKEIFKEAFDTETLTVTYQSALRAISCNYYMNNIYQKPVKKKDFNSNFNEIYDKLK